MSNIGGLTKTIEAILKANDSKRMIEIWKDLILKAYGQKSLDGRQFMKSDEIRESFAQTEAYSDMFMELASDADAAAKFVNGIIPASMSKTTVPSII